MSINVINRKDSTIKATYNTATISHITHDKAKNLFNAHDLAANDCKPNEVLMNIEFNNGENATFIAKDWFITFE